MLPHEPCGCRVYYEEPEQGSSTYSVKFCPLHAAAEETAKQRYALLEALQDLVGNFSSKLLTENENNIRASWHAALGAINQSNPPDADAPETWCDGCQSPTHNGPERQ